MKRTLGEIARHLGGTLVGDEGLEVQGVNALDLAGPEEISFYSDPRYRRALEKTRAGALITAERLDDFRGAQIVVDNPGLAYTLAAGLFAPAVPRFPGVSHDAFVHESATLGEGVSIYPRAYVGAGAEIGDEVILFPGVFVGDRVRIGAGSVLYPNVTVLGGCLLGRNVILHAGTVVGADGFGFVRDGARSVKVPQLGIVQIDDDCEIGANSCIDRAAFGKTWIRRGVKTDNLVQVGHNVVIGEDTIIVAQAGISGSVKVGREAIIGGQVGIRDHVEIGDRVMIASQSGVAKSIPEGRIVSGSPTMPHRVWLKTTGLIPRLPRLFDRLRTLEKRVETLEQDMRER
ncbi:MAG: UDP-3-O-(3-hydroxymyristoyl)glucosamine N-acyltransferase [Deltaproteobacteria bacterium]|nr:UDP-3-O-(3-hydroxymyristoyl)glucosamine N-acyltransferase [Deltaproteobacteria bacterium]MBW2007034.1 UDP-3-O-(3-hydroxymyristoyl)glucosamine N-acyltransferase [Deltaproteobacteria bacterium]